MRETSQFSRLLIVIKSFNHLPSLDSRLRGNDEIVIFLVKMCLVEKAQKVNLEYGR